MPSRLLVWLELTSATRSGLFSKGWSLLTGPVTIFLLVRYLSPSEQGYYYAFIGAVALQSLAELGLGSVLTQAVAKARGRIEASDSAGAAPRILRLRSDSLKASLKWYRGLAVLGVSIVCIFGYFVLAESENFYYLFSVFCFYAFFSAINLFFTPFLALNAGIGKNDEIAVLEFKRQIISALFLWGGLLILGDVTALILQQAGVFIVNAIYIYREYVPTQPSPTLSPALKSDIDWKSDVLPLQAKVAVMAALGAISTNLSNPLLLRIYGAESSGKLGISQNLTNALVACASIWFMARLPDLASLAGARNFREFWRLEGKLLKLGLFTFALAAACFVASVVLLDRVDAQIGERFVAIPILGLICLDGFVILACNTSIYSSRCLGKEYFIPASAALAAVTMSAPFLLASYLEFNSYLLAFFSLKILIFSVTLISARRRMRQLTHQLAN